MTSLSGPPRRISKLAANPRMSDIWEKSVLSRTLISIPTQTVQLNKLQVAQ